MAELELGNILFNTNDNQIYNCPEYVIALLEHIDNEMERIYHNIYHKEYNSPFGNNAEHFRLGNFEIHSYNWNDDEQQEFNFRYKVDKSKSNLDDIKISWYKYLGRDTTVNQELDSSIYVSMFNDIINQLHDYEQKELNKEGIVFNE